MSFSGIFAAGLSGVNAFATGLEAVSNNIANTQTTGFKRARTDFSTLISEKVSSGGQAGGGVDAQNRQLVSEQGAITRTNSATDIAISGDGFFVVSENPNAEDGDTPFLFTRAGGFRPQADGTLINDAGFYLQGAAVDENGAATLSGGLNGLQAVNINRFETLADATGNIGLTGNLSVTAATGRQAISNR